MGIRTVTSRDPVRADGKFLRANGEPFLVRGVAYGTFAPRTDGHLFPELAQVRNDFAMMTEAAINTVRTYTLPPGDVLDAAAEHGLRVFAGLAWPQHVAFLDDRRLRREIVRLIREQARTLSGHPALLLTAIGNEIPPAVVRWHGKRRVEQFIRAAIEDVRDVDPGMLLTYVNYPPTEFLELPSLDVHAFNVYLHNAEAMRAYTARLQHLAGHKPLLLAECGADSQRLGPEEQAALASMQVRVAFSEGACGAVVFGWTDDWWRSGSAIRDWSFGLVDRERRPKAALSAVSQVFSTALHGADAKRNWPAVSVVVCAYNAAGTIDDCLTSLHRLDYPHVDVIVVDDGSTDDTAARAAAYSFVQLIRVPNGGLSAARNVGLHAARGDVVAYVDADVRVDSLWLTHLVQPFVISSAVAAGGPNVAPLDDGWFAQCVARAPGAPNHVMIDDRIAEHIPGCNLAVRRTALLEIGGFDPIFVRAGDDVDVCWRLQSRGGEIAYSASALVWHHHRTTLPAFWRQQVGYGEGEAWLRGRHRHRFSRSGVAWRGRIYSQLPFIQSLSARRLHSGVWGTAAFPTVYQTHAHPLKALPHTPEWQIAALVLLATGVAMLPADHHLLALLAIAAGMAGASITIFKCAAYARRSDIEGLPALPRCGARMSRFVYRATITWLHIVQPFARAYGYLRGLLQPAAAIVEAAPTLAVADVRPHRLQRHDVSLLLGRSFHRRFWSEAWTSGDALLTQIVEHLRALRFGRGVHVDDGWRPDRDISVALGPWAWAHVQALVEDHGAGRCLVRTRIHLRPRPGIVALAALTVVATVTGDAYGGGITAAALALTALLLMAPIARQVSRGARQVIDVFAGVARDHGMQELAAETRDAATAAASSWRRLSATHGS
jgi:GT2 family glycosyltransferase